MNQMVQPDETNPSQDATFTLTNVAPQYRAFNQGPWKQLERMIRKYLENELSGQDVFIITGNILFGLTHLQKNLEKSIIYPHLFYFQIFITHLIQILNCQQKCLL